MRRDVALLELRNNTLTFRVAGSTTDARTRLDDVRAIQFTLTGPMEEGVRAAAAKDWDTVLRTLREPVARMLPYVTIPASNAGDLFDAYAQALLERDRLDPLRDLYQVLVDSGDPETARVARAWLGYLQARAGQPVDLATLYAGLGDVPRTHILGALRDIAYAYQALETNALHRAADSLARVIASASLDMRLYPEALFLSGEAYDGLGLRLQDTLVERRRLQVERELRSERVSVGRRLQKDAEAQGLPPPDEAAIVAAIDREAADARVPPPPPITDNLHARNAQRMYQLILRLYPDSPWAARARERIRPGFRTLDAERAMETSPEPTAQPDSSTTEETTP